MHIERLIMYDFHDAAYYYARHIKRKNRKGSKATRLRRVVFVRDGFTCQECLKKFEVSTDWNGQHVPGLTLGHVVPKSHGGPRTVANLRAQCGPCNTKLDNRVWESQLGLY